MYDLNDLLNQIDETSEEAQEEKTATDLEEIEKLAEYLEKCASPDREIDFLAKLAAWYDFVDVLKKSLVKTKKTSESISPLAQQTLAFGAGGGAVGVGSKLYHEQKMKKKDKELQDKAVQLYLAGRASAGGM
jgi:hypothetical protein